MIEDLYSDYLFFTFATGQPRLSDAGLIGSTQVYHAHGTAGLSLHPQTGPGKRPASPHRQGDLIVKLTWIVIC